MFAARQRGLNQHFPTYSRFFVCFCFQSGAAVEDTQANPNTVAIKATKGMVTSCLVL